jgi:mannosyltransferase
MPPGQYRTCLAILLASAAAVGLFRLGAPGLWLDEAVSWFGSGGPWQRLVERALAGDDTGGILYSILLKPWMALAGDSEFALRLPSVCAMVALVAVMAQVGRLLWGERAALAVGALTLIHPSVLPSGRQARGYILILLFTALCLLGLAWQWLNRQRPSRLLLGIASLAVTAVHVFGVAVVAGTAVASALLDWRHLAGRQWHSRVARAARACIPFLPALLLAACWQVLINPVVHGRLAAFWVPGTVAHNNVLVFVLMLLPALAGGLVIFLGDRTARGRLAATGVLIVAAPVFCAPSLASMLVLGGHNFVAVRYAFALVPLGTLACGYAISRIPWRLAVAVLTVAGVVSLSYSASKNVYSSALRGGQEIKAATTFLKAEVHPGDRVIAVPPWAWFSLAYYGIRTTTTPPAAVDGLSMTTAVPRESGVTWTVVFNPEDRTSARAARATTRRFGTLEVARTATDR